MDSVWPPLFPRTFEVLSPEAPDFSVFQFNTLAQGMETDFVESPAPSLLFPKRGERVLEEITRFSADVVCLEEVNHFQEFSDHLSTFGYSGIFLPKVDSPCTQLGLPGDGCAMFYKNSVFSLEARKDFILLEGNSQVSIIALFKHIPTNRFVCISVAHLKAKAAHEETRWKQIKNLLAAIVAFLPDPSIPVLLAGDLNTEPAGIVYSEIVGHGLGLRSSYNSGTTTDPSNEVPWTTWKVRPSSGHQKLNEVKRTIDYIFYQPKVLKLNSKLSVVDDGLIPQGRLPCYEYPSDHVSIMCRFSFL